jgi:autotransporter-associated beta strand protein
MEENMKKSVMVGMVVAQVLKGVLAQEVPAVVQGASLWMDANQATSFVYDTTDTLKIIEWKDARNNGKVMTANGATPIYTVTDSNLGGKPYVMMDAEEWFSFTRLSDIRTVFWVVRMDATAPFLLGDVGGTSAPYYNFHRGNTAYIWNATYISTSIRYGKTFLNHETVDGTVTALPTDAFKMVSLVTTGNVQASTLTKDRTTAGRTGGMSIAELIIFNTALSDSDRFEVEAYLNEKYALFDIQYKEWINDLASSWNTAGNWNPASVPTTADYVLLTTNGLSVAQVPQITAASGANMRTLTIDSPCVANVLNYGGATPYVQNMYGGLGPMINITGTAGNISVNKVDFRLRANGDLSIKSGTTFTLGNSYISQNGTQKLTLTGGGTLAFSGTSSTKMTFTGGLDIESGTLSASQNASSVPATGIINFTNAEGVAGRITTVVSFSIEALSGGNSSSTITEGASSIPQMTITGSRNTVFGGKITGGLAVAHSGSGSLTLTATNDFTGGTTIDGGTLVLGNGTTLNGSVVGNITNDAALVFANPLAQTYASVVSGTGSLTKRGAGTLTFSSAQTYTGATSIEAGMLAINVVNGVHSNSLLTVDAGATFNMNNRSQAFSKLPLVAGAVATGTGVLKVEGVYSPGNEGVITNLSYPCAMTFRGTYKVDVTTSGACDTLAVNGDLDVSGLIVDVVDLEQLSLKKEYTIITYTGELTSIGTRLASNVETKNSILAVRIDPVAKVVKILSKGGTVLTFF